MYHVSFPPQSNRSSWVFLGLVCDLENNPIDLSTCTMSFGVNDKFGSPRLWATTENGKISYPDIGIFRWFFHREEMRGLEPGSYDTGLTLTNDDGTQTIQLSVGPLPIVDGVAP